MPKKKIIRERMITFIARDQSDIDDLVVNFTIDLEKKDGRVFATQTHILPESNPKHKPKDEKDPYLVYVYVVFYKVPVEIDVADEVPNNAVVTAEKPKVEKTFATKWCTCPSCKSINRPKWGWDKYRKCGCGNDIPPKEIEEEFFKIWGRK
jgi:hypothetical protein